MDVVTKQLFRKIWVEAPDKRAKDDSGKKNTVKARGISLERNQEWKGEPVILWQQNSSSYTISNMFNYKNPEIRDTETDVETLSADTDNDQIFCLEQTLDHFFFILIDYYFSHLCKGGY